MTTSTTPKTQMDYKLVLDSLMTAVIVVDDNLRIYHLNASAEFLFGLSCDQMQGRHIHDCFSAKDGTPNSLQHALRENLNFTKRKAQWTLHNQQKITVDYSVSPSPETGNIIIEVQPQDRLMKISREEALLSYRETSRNLARSLAHEIKNPLGGIRGAAQLLSKEFNDSELCEYTRVIIDETDRLRNLVDRLLGPNKPSQKALLNIHSVLEHVATIIRAESKNQIEVKRDYDPSIPELLGDQEQLIQAVLNIARNAMQALQELEDETAPCITLSTRIQRQYTIGKTYYPLVVRIGIEDNGPGIPESIIDDIFLPMISGRASGTGLGLSIAQNLIGQHNGLIEYQNKTHATEFVIYIPLRTHDDF
ncbi:nitrogen regulation protein NR(II) [Teredinibacter sp. KSP-S5-2]|uniref:nitrogen regulation protein NR(II) n=1 Tax=Teredinibacter sp. KSP-S5-2 TaxID=3034506 RepID=UPI0029342936|nr:nitrogen regulation protein NR(II) [Teredinibacter sp. KSP-S5-2]WNO08789.1 nitrogen regulation protein NR(II) [Teredinibacter sp. KSP-S5-2]